MCNNRNNYGNRCGGRCDNAIASEIENRCCGGGGCGGWGNNCSCSNRRAYRRGFEDGYNVGFRDGCIFCGDTIDPRSFAEGSREGLAAAFQNEGGCGFQ